MKTDEAGIHLKTQGKNSKIQQKKVKGNNKDKIRSYSHSKTSQRTIVHKMWSSRRL